LQTTRRKGAILIDKPSKKKKKIKLAKSQNEKKTKLVESPDARRNKRKSIESTHSREDTSALELQLTNHKPYLTNTT
jgi:hypothetical protein